MPAINVARTDTFEIQRQKINQIGNQIFNISQGGSDLATGNLKLGDGTKTAPSLAFTQEADLGLYRPGVSTVGYVSAGKKLFDISSTTITSYKDFIVQKNIITNVGSFIKSSGSGYDAGLYDNISLLGGTGSGALAQITVDSFVGTIVSSGNNYLPGDYVSIVTTTNGSGTDNQVSFSVDDLEGIITDAGSGYPSGNYTSVPLTGGSGSGAEADILITGDSNLIGSVTNPGSGYTEGTYSSIQLTNTPTQTFVVTTISNPGTPPPDNVFVIDGNTQPTLSLVKGNTYRFDLSDSSVSGHPFSFQSGGQPLDFNHYAFVYNGNSGEAGAFVDLIIKPSAPTETIEYYCSIHSGMGSDANVVSGSIGSYGSSLFANIEVNASGAISSFVFSNVGTGVQIGDVIQIVPNPFTIGSGSGFEYTISNIEYNGVVQSVTITNIGLNYVNGDVLSASNTDLGGASTTNFAFSITSEPGIIKDFSFTSKGSGYSIGDTISLPVQVTGVTGNIVDTNDTTITVSSAQGIYPGFTFTQTGGTGSIPDGTILAVNESTNQISFSVSPTSTGTITLTLTPEYGNPTTNFSFVVDKLGAVTDVDIVDGGNGYSVSDILSTNPTDLAETIDYLVTIKVLQEIDFVNQIADTEFSVGDSLKLLDGQVTGTSLASSSVLLGESGNTYSITNTTTNGTGVGVEISLTRDQLGAIDPSSITVTSQGSRYADGDTITISGSLVGGSSPADDVVLNVTAVSERTPTVIYDIRSSGGFITSIILDNSFYVDGDFLVKSDSYATTYELSTASSQFERYFLNGNYLPDITLYAGNTYVFDFSDGSNSNAVFSLSKFRDGIFSPSLISNVLTTLSTSTKEITVSSTSNILEGMLVTVVSGDGSVIQNTLVETVIDSTTIELSEFPSAAGSCVINFSGVEYLDGVLRSQDSLTIKVSDTTPNLYYYNAASENYGGEDNNESQFIIDTNNSRVFGSGFELEISAITSQDIIVSDVNTGELTAVDFIGSTLQCSTGNFSGLVNCSTLTSPQINTTTITSAAALSVSAVTFNIESNVSIGNEIQIQRLSGNITSSGEIKTTGNINVNDYLNIADNIISSTANNDIILDPPVSRIVKVDSTTALVIPSGTDAQRPTAAVRQNGSIRFNTTTNQYEGYRESTSSWASLGGVRDIDGNTYILAELTAGANDNTLWFYNDNVNTLKLTPQFLDFRSVKKISSGRLGLPAFTVWSANTAVVIGQYIKYKNNLYEVTANGTTGTSGNEPTHTSGVANNGTAQLTWYSSSVSPLTFEEVEELRVGPNKDCPLIVGSELKLSDNTISTIVQDLVLAPNAGKKVSIDAPTSLVIPVGNTNQRGSASQGSIRFNTTISQFEGYSGTNWSSLGGVRDVDGNTYIIPETAPAANENILYFYNDGTNTLQLSSTELDFTSIDTITTSGGNSLAINTNIVTIDNSATTIDNTDSSSSFISTTKQYLDLGLSSGLNVDPVLRLDDQGDVYLNTGFGTGTFAGVKIFDGDLKDFELADYLVKTSVLSLIKGTSNSGAVVLYNTSTAKGCRVTVVSKSSTGKKSMVEYNVIDNGTDIFHNEFGSLNTSADGFEASFDITPGNETRITLTLSDDHATNDTVEITVLTQVVK